MFSSKSVILIDLQSVHISNKNTYSVHMLIANITYIKGKNHLEFIALINGKNVCNIHMLQMNNDTLGRHSAQRITSCFGFLNIPCQKQ